MIEPKPINAQYNDEQWQAIQQIGSNILVAASAGSGKTTVLIERILTHIRKRYASLNQLLVVTFTEAAANEMKERMEVKLKQALYSPEQPIEQGLILEQLNQLPMAHIRTLHSFCLQVIQQFFYLIDFNPSFNLMTDETQKQLLYQEAWEALLSDIMEERIDGIDIIDLRDLLSRYANPRDDQGLFDLVLDLHHFSSSHPEPEIWLANLSHHSQYFGDFTKSTLYKQHLAPTLKSALQSAYQLYLQSEQTLGSASAEVFNKYHDFLSEEREQASQLLELLYTDNLEALSLMLGQLGFKRWPTKPRKTEEGELIEQLKQLRDQAKKLITDQVASAFVLDYEELARIEADVAPIIAQLGRLTIAYKEALNERKRQLNIIDYSDLEHLTLDILAPYNNETKQRKPSLAAKHYQALFKEVLVDEYQDINEIQATILSWLSHENNTELTGNLFMVGDVKQSIYGFRMAEPSLFMDKYLRYQAHDGGELIVLDKNYRSRDEVLQFTNFIFERIMDEQFGEMQYGLQESLKTGNLSFEPSAPNEQFNIQLLLHQKENEQEDEEEAIFDTTIEVQSHIVAQDIFKRVAAKEMIYDKSLKAVRPVEYRDFVILTTTRSPFLSIQQAFQLYDIPLNAQNVETYFQRHEVQLMIALLKLIDNTRQDLPLVAILRSFFVGITDEELSQIRIQQMHGSFYDAYLHYLQQNDDELAVKLQRFNQQLMAWQQASSERSLVELIWLIYQETYFLDYVAGLSNGEQRQANLHAFYEHAAKFEQMNFKGVFGFVRYIEELTQYNNDLAEPVVLGDDQNFVRIMTVHASKGLEFPIVYLMNLNKSFNLQDVRSKRYILSKNFGLGSDLYDYTHLLRYPSFVKEAIKLEKTMSLKAEELRKLYVALTRCEQQLILVGTIKSEEDWLAKSETTRQITDVSEKLVNLQERQQANSWLEWIRMGIAVANTTAPKVTNFDVSQITTQFISEQEIGAIRQQLGQVKTSQNKDNWLSYTMEQVKQAPAMQTPLLTLMSELSNAKYAYQLASHTSSYQSVSELKRLYEEPTHDQLGHFYDRTKEQQEEVKLSQQRIQSIRYTYDTFEPPKFMQEKEMTYAEIGTWTHYLMQQLDFAAFESTDDISQVLTKQIEQMIADGRLTQAQVQKIQLDTIEWFIQSAEGQALVKNAPNTYKEQAFSYLLPAEWLFKAQVSSEDIQQLQDNQLLIHGIIDTYYHEDDGLVILDYKTDRFRPYGNLTRLEQIELIADKYKFQLSLYSQALSQAKNMPIHRVAIVLLDFKEVYVYEDLYEFG